jgi:chaperone modulatory protein CbpM
MTRVVVTHGVCIDHEQALDIETFAVACQSDVAYIHELLDEGLLAPLADQTPWRFGGQALARVRRIRRLQRDFEAPLASVAVMLELLDQIDELRAQLRRAGIANA